MERTAPSRTPAAAGPAGRGRLRRAARGGGRPRAVPTPLRARPPTGGTHAGETPPEGSRSPPGRASLGGATPGPGLGTCHPPAPRSPLPSGPSPAPGESSGQGLGRDRAPRPLAGAAAAAPGAGAGLSAVAPNPPPSPLPRQLRPSVRAAPRPGAGPGDAAPLRQRSPARIPTASPPPLLLPPAPLRSPRVIVPGSGWRHPVLPRRLPAEGRGPETKE